VLQFVALPLVLGLGGQSLVLTAARPTQTMDDARRADGGRVR
jgi:hypothetical protein